MKNETTIIKDERYTVAEEAIVEAFYLLLAEKSIEKITVSEIVKQAGIVRSTFYNHYETVQDLVSSIEDATVERIFQMLKAFHPENDREICYRFYQVLCTYVRDNPLLSQQIKSPTGNSFISKIITMFHRYVTNNERLGRSSGQEKEKTTYAVAYAIGGALGILHKWANDNYDCPVETVAQYLTQGMVKNSII